MPQGRSFGNSAARRAIRGSGDSRDFALRRFTPSRCFDGGDAKGTGYVFVSHEKTNNIAVIDPKQDYRIIKWIDVSTVRAT